MTQAPSDTGRHVLTKEFIVKECVKQGFYRTPSCNEKLYLHHKGFDGVHSKAFAEYTDVKVLWLEGNCLSSLQCGRRGDYSLEDAVKDKEVDSDKEAGEVTASSGESEPPAVSSDVAAQPPCADACAAASLARDDTMDVGAADSSAPVLNAVDSVDANSSPKATAVAAAPSSTSSKVAQPTSSSSGCADHVDIFATMYPTLRQLFLHGNMFTTMPDLHQFRALDTVNLSDNFIQEVELYCPDWCRAQQAQEVLEALSDGAPSPEKSADVKRSSNGVVDKSEHAAHMARQVSAWLQRCSHVAGESPCICGTLTTLYLKNNHLTTVRNIAALLCLKNLSVVDLSGNRLEDGEGVLQVLEKMPNLKALYLSGNPCVRSIANYRKTIISRCKKLMHLDDRPVFDDERRLVTAWASGGIEAEKKERQLMKQEEEERHRKRLQEFRDMMAAARGGHDPLDTSTEEDTDSNPTPPSSSSDNDEADAAPQKNPKPIRGPAASRSDPIETKPPATRHTEFYELNYGSKSKEPEQRSEEAVPARRPDDGEDGVSFGNFRVVPKHSTQATTGRPAPAAATHSREGRNAPAVSHVDPTAMTQVAAPALISDDCEDELWVPPTEVQATPTTQQQ